VSNSQHATGRPAKQAASRRLDWRAPLVLDTRSLGRRAGSMIELQQTVTAPAPLGLDLAHVPEGAAVALDLRLEAVEEGVLVSGTVDTSYRAECSRCLESVTGPLSVRLTELYAYDPAEVRRRGFRNNPVEEDEEIAHLVGDLLDLEPALRDAVALELPANPLCDPDCAGLCPTCGVRLDDDPEHTHDDAPDARWAALRALTDGDSTAAAGGQSGE
jgi:uncharacterized protein